MPDISSPAQPPATTTPNGMREALCAILRLPEFGVLHAALFGSYARHEARPFTDAHPSDVDIMVEVTPGTTYFQLMRLRRVLEQACGCQVDLLTRAEVERAHPLVRESILVDAEPLL